MGKAAALTIASILMVAMASAYEAASGIKYLQASIPLPPSAGSGQPTANAGSGGDTGIYHGCYGCVRNGTVMMKAGKPEPQDGTDVSGDVRHADDGKDILSLDQASPMTMPLAPPVSTFPEMETSPSPGAAGRWAYPDFFLLGMALLAFLVAGFLFFIARDDWQDEEEDR